MRLEMRKEPGNETRDKEGDWEMRLWKDRSCSRI